MAGSGALDGLVEISPIERGLPEAIREAEATRKALTLLLFRPTAVSDPATGAHSRSSSDLTDLAAALAASLEDGQALFEVGKGYLAVVMEGVSKFAARGVARRAFVCGAPSFTWVATRYPRDARTARGLAQGAARKMRADVEGATARRTKVLWAVTASLLAVGALVYFAGPSGPAQSTGGHFAVQSNDTGGGGATGGQGSGSTHTATGASDSSGSAVEGYSGTGNGNAANGGTQRGVSAASNGSGSTTSASNTSGVGSIISAVSGGSATTATSSDGHGGAPLGSDGATPGTSSGSGSSVGISGVTQSSGATGSVGSVTSGIGTATQGTGTTQSTGTSSGSGTGSGSGSGSGTNTGGSGTGSGSSPTTTPTTTPPSTTTTTQAPKTCLPPLVLVGTVCVSTSSL